MAEFTFTRRIAAPPEVVFDAITDHRRYSDYTRIRRAELEREGDEAPNGEGAIRALHLLGPPMRERVIGFERPRRFSYELLSGLPVRDHVGTVTLEPDGSGTTMTYRVVTTPTLPFGGFAVVAGFRFAISGLIDGVQREAEGRVAA